MRGRGFGRSRAKAGPFCVELFDTLAHGIWDLPKLFLLLCLYMLISPLPTFNVM